VLILVGLAYSAGIGLYVLDKGVIDRAKAVFVPNPEWTVYRSEGEKYQVEMPRKRQRVGAEVLLPRRWNLTAYQGQSGDGTVFVVGSAMDPGVENQAKQEKMKARANAAARPKAK